MPVLHKSINANPLHAQFGRYVCYQPTAQSGSINMVYQSGIPSDTTNAVDWASGYWESRFTGVDYRVESV